MRDLQFIEAIQSFINASVAYSTKFGVAWWYVNFIFRAVVSMSGFARNMYTDSLKEMTCDTKLPGCKQVC